MSDPLLRKKKKRKGGKTEGERENIPRVKALIITLNLAEERSQSLLYTPLCACFSHCCYCIYNLRCNKIKGFFSAHITLALKY